MSKKNLLYRFLFLLLISLSVGGIKGYAQARFNADSATKARQAELTIRRAEQKRTLDAARDARKDIIEATREAQKQRLDSMRSAQKERLDSLKEIRAARAAELQAIRKHRESRQYRDSVKDAREEKLAVIRDAQRARLDSLKDGRQRVTDSIVDAREAATAARKAIQKQRGDSLAVIRNYRNSKRFSDSVAIVQRVRLDSLHDARQAFTDSLTSVRKARLDSMKADRKVLTDSLAAIRKLRTDSLNLKRKSRADASAKREENKLRDKKIKDKQTEQKFNLALELKIKKKRSVYSNENMLKKKWTPVRRFFQNTYTHYNYYFNANRKMEEAEANMNRSAKDDWEERITLFDFDPLKDSTRFASDMDSVIQKTSLGIQIHDPRTKWSDDLYLLLGKAYYFKGDKENASNAFKYIVSINEKEKALAAKKAKTKGRFKKEAPSIVTPQQTGIAAIIKRNPATNNGLLWLVRTNTAYGDYDRAESLLDLLNADAKFPENMKGRLATEKAFLALRKDNEKEAITQLSIVSADKNLPTDLRRRAAYLNGQLMQAEGQFTTAADQFSLVSDLHPKIDMDFYARRNRAYALMQSGGVQTDAIASLKSMLNDGKFRTYYEQVYYVLGRLSANSGKTSEAIAYLREGINSVRSTKKQKAVSFAALGNIYFNQADYQNAKSAYDSAVRLAQYAPDDSSVMLASSRVAIVDKVADPARVIRIQDSLLALAALPEKEQKLVVKRFIRAWEKQKADSTFLAENAGSLAIAGPGVPASNDPSAMTWYFSTPVLVQQGKSEFKRIWGDRPDIDNWRRSSAVAASSGKIANSGIGSEESGDAENGSFEGNGAPTEAVLMGYIPRTDEARSTAVNRLQRAYLDMSTAYVKQFNDYSRATIALNTLEKRWPGNPYAAEATYLRYLIALRENKLADAQAYSTDIRKNFSNTEFADLVGTASGTNSELDANKVSIDEYYSTTYKLLQDRQYGEVLGRARNSRRQFPNDEKYTNMFKVVEAVAFAGSAQYKQADTLLQKFVKENPKDTLVPWANEILRIVGEKIKADTLKRTPDSSIIATKFLNPGGRTVTTDSVELPPPDNYSYQPNSVHYFLFAVSKMESKAMGVKAGISDFNNFTSANDDLTVDIQPLSAGQAIIVVKSFKNAVAAKRYLTMFNAARSLVREYKPGEYEVYTISARNYQKLSAEGQLEPYRAFYKSKYK